MNRRDSWLQQPSDAIVGEHVTPAMLQRADVVDACHKMVQSEYPASLQAYMQMHWPDDQVWQVVVIGEETRDLSLIPNDLVVTLTTPLSDELVTLGCLLLFPQDVYQEFLSSPALLDKSILQDYYLGKLVGRTLLTAIHEKLVSYQGEHDLIRLRELYSKSESSLTIDEQRALYGLTIRLEEKACLEALRKQVLEIMDSLDDNVDDSVARQDGTVTSDSPPASTCGTKRLLDSKE